MRIDALLQPTAYAHPVDRVELAETHLSWLLLAGEFAYKIKKPVRFDFVDFSQLAQRKSYCEEELRLNRHFTPELYLEVVPITGSEEAPRWGGSGPVIDYAVMMRRFASEDRLDRVLARGALQPEHCDSLAETIARAHLAAARAASDGPFGTPAEARRVLVDALVLARQTLPAAAAARIDALQAEGEAEWQRLVPTIEARLRAGFVRECHGDLHLENMLLWQDRVRLFDCLEFSPRLRWIDVMSDVAFATMDLAHRGAADLSARLLNRYLELTDDYAGLALLPYFQVYRAAVRAAVAGARAEQAGIAPAERDRQLNAASEYLDLAAACGRRRRPWIALTHGLSGSGKSTASERLVELLSAIRLRSDVQRDRLPLLANEEKYAPASRARIYRHLGELAGRVIDAGFPVIVDATFLRRDDRARFVELAAQRQTPLVVLEFAQPHDELRRRIAARRQQGTDASEATAEVLDLQLREHEPIDAEERARLTVLAASELPLAELADRLRASVRAAGG